MPSHKRNTLRTILVGKTDRKPRQKTSNIAMMSAINSGNRHPLLAPSNRFQDHTKRPKMSQKVPYEYFFLTGIQLLALFARLLENCSTEKRNELALGFLYPIREAPFLF